MIRLLLPLFAVFALALSAGCGKPCTTNLDCLVTCSCPSGGTGSVSYPCSSGVCPYDRDPEADCARICGGVPTGDDDDFPTPSGDDDDDDSAADDDDSGAS